MGGRQVVRNVSAHGRRAHRKCLPAETYVVNFNHTVLVGLLQGLGWVLDDGLAAFDLILGELVREEPLDRLAPERLCHFRDGFCHLVRLEHAITPRGCERPRQRYRRRAEAGEEHNQSTPDSGDEGGAVRAHTLHPGRTIRNATSAAVYAAMITSALGPVTSAAPTTIVVATGAMNPSRWHPRSLDINHDER